MSTGFMPTVIEGQNVDLISPFPPAYLDRLVKWTHQFKSLLTWDLGPQTDSEILESMSNAILNKPTYGVVDKYNKIGLPNPEGPIVVGAFILDEASPVNLYAHVVTQRRAWGKGLMDEGGRLLIDTLFNERPDLLRISATMLANNNAAISFVKKFGFKREGVMPHMVRVAGKPTDCVHMGLTREQYNNFTNPPDILKEI